MLIGELSKATGFSRDTIRFYEKQGLIKLSRKNRKANNYKDYPEEVLKKLLTIKRLKGYGFTLNESSDLIVLMEENMADCYTVNEKVTGKVKAIEEKINELTQIKNKLLGGVSACLNGATPSADKACSFLPMPI